MAPGEADVWVSRDTFLGVLDSAVGRDDVRITFDDGNASDYDCALPALKERGLNATFFVVGGRVGTPGFLDAGAIRELSSAGMKIGSHGMEHRRWRGLTDQQLRDDLVQAKEILEATVGRPVTEAACPFGAYDRRVLCTLRNVGYRFVYTSDCGIARPGDFLQARNSVRQHDAHGLLGRIAMRDAVVHEALIRKAKLTVKRWR
jgi:peptidoglycan/xylan/chitin deacetylase (PgdA/CDA1 family)